MLKYDINVLNSVSNSIHLARLMVYEKSDGVTISLLLGDKVYEGVDTFPFVALSKVRKLLELDNLMLCCKGCRVDVHPSGGMLVGYNAYQLVIGQQAHDKDIVCIFDAENDTIMLGTVKEQKVRYERWVNSL